mgnify:CR=1 FL=1
MKTLIVEQKDFPEKLKKIENAPKRLFYIGNIKLLYEDCFAIVGTRRITKYGIKICEKFSKEFALRDIPIVSGMAIGTDSIAHKNVLKYEGKTIAVLGSGLEKIYPQQNCNLFKEIIEKEGLILSEYDNNVPANKDNFPLRNRIVSAISEGVLVIEAAWRSGTTITANYANKQGKLVFAIPGNLDSTYSQGVNILIKNGAMLTTSIEDILINYPQFMNKKRKEEKQIKVKKEYKQIYKILENGECTLEYLLNSTNLEIKEMLHILSNMEFEGIIFKEIGVYKLNE